MKRLLENPKQKFELLSKIFCYGSVFVGIFTLLTYIANGITIGKDISLYVITGFIYAVSSILTGWTLGLIMLWLKSTYKEGDSTP